MEAYDESGKVVVIPYQVRSYQTQVVAPVVGQVVALVVIPYQVRSYQTFLFMISQVRKYVVIPYQVRSYQTKGKNAKTRWQEFCSRNPLSSQVISNRRKLKAA